MNKKLLIDDYLQGKHPIEHDSWELPTEGELDRDEALYDALLEEREKTPLHTGRGWGWVSVAAVLAIVFALFTWKSQTSESLPPTLEKTAESVVLKDTAQAPVAIANATRRDDQRHASRLQEPRIARRTPTNQNTLNTPIAQNTQEPSTAEPQLLHAADSLYYYLTQLENQMGDCRDSTCLAELTGLMRADERIKDLVNKIIHKQVETAYQEEYLVDTTTRYIPL